MNLKTKTILVVIIISIGVFLYLSSKDDRQKTNVILITIDTLRADHLSAYGYGRKTSPAIDSLAGDGILFKDAIVTLPKTSPSLASILSGLYPKTHKLFSLGFELDNAIQLLPEILKEKGYLTGGVCGQYNCNRKFGFKQGFDYYDDKFVYTYDKSMENVGGEFHSVSERRAEYVIEKSIEWIKKVKVKGDPSFTWIHLMDPHAAYDPPGKYGAFFSGSTTHTSNSFFGENIPVHLIHPQAAVSGMTSYNYYLNRYDGEIRYMDSYLKKLFDFLKDNGLYDDTLIILTSDHGEYMGEQNSQIRYFSHGSTLLESEIRVPLIVKLPGNTSSNQESVFPCCIIGGYFSYDN